MNNGHMNNMIVPAMLEIGDADHSKDCVSVATAENQWQQQRMQYCWRRRRHVLRTVFKSIGPHVFKVRISLHGIFFGLNVVHRLILS
jgi:hypothetical protein